MLQLCVKSIKLWLYIRSWFVGPSYTDNNSSPHPLGLLTFYLSVSLSVSVSSFKRQPDWAGARVVVRADHQHQWCHAVGWRHVHLFPLHHARQNGQSIHDCSGWVQTSCLEEMSHLSDLLYIYIIIIILTFFRNTLNTRSTTQSCRTKCSKEKPLFSVS